MSDSRPYPDCENFASIYSVESFGHAHEDKSPDCASCVYFSSRNCGKDTGMDRELFGQDFI